MELGVVLSNGGGETMAAAGTPSDLEKRAQARSDHLEMASNQETVLHRRGLIRQHIFHQPHGKESWKLLPEFPTSQGIMVSQEDAEVLPENQLNRKWSSIDGYLETQYRLARREGSEPLRYVVNNYRARKTPNDNEDVCIYSKVHVRGYLLTRLGTMCRISFSTDRAKKKVNWLQSQRLMPGTVVAISPKSDNFRFVCMVATVAQRPYRDGLEKNPPEIDIVWADPDQSVIDPDMELVMIEARIGYYEAVRHTLIGLQMASDSESPLFKYVLGHDMDDHLASFIADKPVIDLTPILHSEVDATTREWARAYRVTDYTPDVLSCTSLDESQYHALYRMITKELCIVQGPPGTGKTFTSVQALKCFLTSQKKGDPPIIIAAQTNHALDQLLNLCLDAGARVVRIGGRTDSERIADHSLYKIRQKFSLGPSGMARAFNSDRQKFNQEITGLANTFFNSNLLEPIDLLEAGLLTKEQYRSLMDEDAERNDSFDNVDGPLSIWLGGEIVPNDILRDKYSEQDLRPTGDDEEYFQNEYELEGDDVEHIAADEDDNDRIHGLYVPLAYTWSGKLPPGQNISWRKLAKKELKNQDLYSVPKHMRGAVYQYLHEQYVGTLGPRFVEHFKEYNRICKELKACKWQQDADMILSLGLNIVGCTTTGLTKYRGLLAALEPKTMLIEEAAETREANIVSALYPSIQQLILVGDHQQLAPFSNVKWLSQDPYFLDISLFERMVDWLGLPYIMLDKQRRMAPEIRAIVDKFYDGLQDHPVALTREPVPGMGDRQSWLFHHTWEDATDANHSRYNLEEADMIVNFFVYLVHNGTKPNKITILTYYMAQRKKILQRLRQHPSLVAESYNVHTVDSYQGEENDVVLLSLVRSPPAHMEHAVGFLDSKNRAIVAISRARRGFYVFGNIVNAIRASEQSEKIWGLIHDAFDLQNRVDHTLGLPLQCQPHGKTIWIKHNGWADNAGGCDERCDHVRPCGHQCTLKCHVKSHDQIRCSQVCNKVLSCGHKCQIWCKDPCNCLCENFQSTKQKARTRILLEESRHYSNLETMMQQHQDARRQGVSQRAVPQRIMPQQMVPPPIMPQHVPVPTRQRGSVLVYQNGVPHVFEDKNEQCLPQWRNIPQQHVPRQQMPQQRAPYPPPSKAMQQRQKAVAQQTISRQAKPQHALHQQLRRQPVTVQQGIPQHAAPHQTISQQALPQFIEPQSGVPQRSMPQHSMPQQAPGPSSTRPQFDSRSTMDLEDILRAEAGVTPRHFRTAPVPSHSQPAQGQNVWDSSRALADPDDDVFTGPSQTEFMDYHSRQSSVGATVVLNVRPLPLMIPPTTINEPTGSALRQMRDPVATGFQDFADNASTYDRTFARTQRELMADADNFEPDIVDKYIPVGIVNGQRVNFAPGDAFPANQSTMQPERQTTVKPESIGFVGRVTSATELRRESMHNLPADAFGLIDDGSDVATEHAVEFEDDDMISFADEYSSTSRSGAHQLTDPASNSFRPIRDSESDRPGHHQGAAMAMVKDLIDMGVDNLMSLDQIPQKKNDRKDVDNWMSGLTIGAAPPSTADSRPSTSWSAELSSIAVTETSQPDVPPLSLLDHFEPYAGK